MKRSLRERAHKLELPSSDVDVVVFGAPVDKGSGGVAKRLRTLASALEDRGMVPCPFVRHRRGSAAATCRWE